MLFRERLRVPIVWWVLAALAAVSMLLAIGFYLGPVWGVGVALACLAVAIGIFASAAIVIEVDASEVRVGRARLEHAYVAGAIALDRAAASRRGGVDADARAYLVLRSYVTTAVEITLNDPADPVPYWLVSSRRPDELATALRQVAARGAGH